MKHPFSALREDPDYELRPPVFITGCMRSGTTLFFGSVTEHPQLLRLGWELRNVWTHLGGAPCEESCEFRGREHVDPRFTSAMASYFGRSVERADSWRGFAHRCIRRRRDGSGGLKKDFRSLHPVNKSTHLMNKLGYVHGLFPDAKIIVIVREVHAQVNSLKLHFARLARERGLVHSLPADPRGCWTAASGDDSAPTIATLAEGWIRLNRLALEEVATMPGSARVVAYEGLVTDPRHVYEEVFSFLGLDERYRAVERRIASVPRRPVNALTSDPLTAWRGRLSEAEQKEIDEVIATRRSDYDFIRDSLPPPARRSDESK